MKVSIYFYILWLILLAFSYSTVNNPTVLNITLLVFFYGIVSSLMSLNAAEIRWRECFKSERGVEWSQQDDNWTTNQIVLLSSFWGVALTLFVGCLLIRDIVSGFKFLFKQFNS